MKILVVEDEIQFIEFIKESGCEVLIAENVIEALNILASEEIKLVYCDFHGIQKDGKDAHDVIKTCVSKGIESKLTSSDLERAKEFGSLYGIASISKMEMLSSL